MERQPDATVACTAGVARCGEDTDWLVRSVGEIPSQPVIWFTSRPLIEGILSLNGSPAMVVYLPRDGQISARVVHTDGKTDPLPVRLIAPGLPQTGMPVPIAPTSGERWSRLQGALGRHVVLRLQSLRFALIGCGRSGSMLAHTLARLGVSHLTLIDPDEVEAHNLDGDGFTPARLGKPKVQALEDSLGQINPLLSVQPVQSVISSISALEAVKPVDVLICAADNDGARWICGAISACYLKPLLDVGVSVESENRMGADIRWIVPGDRCLQCFGGIAAPDHLQPVLQGLTAEREFQQQRRWRAERAGSLRSLNMIAVGLAVRMMEDYLRGTLERSRWLRITFNGLEPMLEVIETGRPHACLCRFSGGGDAAVHNAVVAKR